MVTGAPRFHTPGRILSILSINKLRLRDVKWFVRGHTAFRAEPKTASQLDSVFTVWSQATRRSLEDGWTPPLQTQDSPMLGTEVGQVWRQPGHIWVSGSSQQK